MDLNKKLRLDKKVKLNKKAQESGGLWSTLLPWIIGLILLVILSVIIYLSRERMFELWEGIKNILRFGP